MNGTHRLTDFFAKRQSTDFDRHLRSVDFSLMHHIMSQHSFAAFDELVHFCRDKRNLAGFLPDSRDQEIFSDRLVVALAEFNRWSGPESGPSPEAR
jgi:hypothetical protein